MIWLLPGPLWHEQPVSNQYIGLGESRALGDRTSAVQRCDSQAMRGLSALSVRDLCLRKPDHVGEHLPYRIPRLLELPEGLWGVKKPRPFTNLPVYPASFSLGELNKLPDFENVFEHMYSENSTPGIQSQPSGDSFLI